LPIPGAQGGTPLSSGDGSLQRLPSGRPSSSTSGGTATPYKARWEPGALHSRHAVETLT